MIGIDPRNRLPGLQINLPVGFPIPGRTEWRSEYRFQPISPSIYIQLKNLKEAPASGYLRTIQINCRPVCLSKRVPPNSGWTICFRFCSINSGGTLKKCSLAKKLHLQASIVKGVYIYSWTLKSICDEMCTPMQHALEMFGLSGPYMEKLWRMHMEVDGRNLVEQVEYRKLVVSIESMEASTTSMEASTRTMEASFPWKLLRQ